MKRRTRHCVPMTYGPKVDAVFDGGCRQTIRMGRRYAVGDTVTFFEWTGKPYRSPWGRRVVVKLTFIADIKLRPDGMAWNVDGRPGKRAVWQTEPWESAFCDRVAKRDGIDPPTGAELKRVLESFHGPLTGQAAQVLRW